MLMITHFAYSEDESDTLTRIQVIEMTLKELGYDTNIMKSHQLLDKALDLNLLSDQKYDDLYQRPFEKATRQEVARLLWNSKTNNKLIKKLYHQDAIRDLNHVQAICKVPVIEMVASGIMLLDNEHFKPNHTVTKDILNAILFRYRHPNERPKKLLKDIININQIISDEEKGSYNLELLSQGHLKLSKDIEVNDKLNQLIVYLFSVDNVRITEKLNDYLDKVVDDNQYFEWQTTSNNRQVLISSHKTYVTLRFTYIGNHDLKEASP